MKRIVVLIKCSQILVLTNKVYKINEHQNLNILVQFQN